MILGGAVRLPTGELVPRRSAVHLRNLMMLATMVEVGRVDVSEPPGPAVVLLEPLALESHTRVGERELAGACA